MILKLAMAQFIKEDKDGDPKHLIQLCHKHKEFPNSDCNFWYSLFLFSIPGRVKISKGHVKTTELLLLLQKTISDVIRIKQGIFACGESLAHIAYQAGQTLLKNNLMSSVVKQCGIWLWQYVKRPCFRTRTATQR